MATTEFFKEIHDEINSIFNPEFPLKITTTTTVPNVEDAGFTLATGASHKAKSIKTCVLFIDIRNSTQLNLKFSEEDLAKLYSAFITTMLRASEYYGGYVRNINGDRIMVVFDVEDCFHNAVKTATLLNTIAAYLIDHFFKTEDFQCGIGIDYGSMLVVKTGTIKKGKENQFYKSFVWLGKPANLASKLTDLANKESFFIKIMRRVKAIRIDPVTKKLSFIDSDKIAIIDINAFAENLTKQTATDEVKHQGNKVYYWSKEKATKHSILMTKEVYDGLIANNSTCAFIKSNLIAPSTVKVKGYTEQVYGMNAYYPNVKNVLQ